MEILNNKISQRKLKAYQISFKFLQEQTSQYALIKMELYTLLERICMDNWAFRELISCKQMSQ